MNLRPNTKRRRRALSDVPGWVLNSLIAWGKQKRRIWFGGYDYRDSAGGEHVHIDGFAPTSLLARIRIEREGAGEGNVAKQKWAEVYTGTALQVQICLFGLPEVPWFALHLQYVLANACPVGDRIEALGVGRTKYFHALSRGQTWVHARLDDDPRKPGAMVVEEQIARIMILDPDAEISADSQVFDAQGGNRLHPGGSIGRIRGNPAEMAELSFRGLGRPVLSLRRR